MVNYFSCNGGALRLTDLPGYGFARVSDAEKEKWGVLLDAYFKTAQNIKLVFVLVDIRITPSPDDLVMLNFLYSYNISFKVVLTKGDKLSPTACEARKSAIAVDLRLGSDDLIISSSLKNKGKEEILALISV
jgi:GTP-binding protein